MFIESTKHLKQNKNSIKIPRPPNDHYCLQNELLLLPLLYRSRLDFVDDNRKVLLHLPLRTSALEL